MEPAVYVVGHRHPDTDSICSAIAYAHLKNCLGEPRVRPARAGEISGETAFVLSRFGVAAPELLDDATGLDLILVDHNEVDQAPPHIEQAHVVEIWEHHRLGDLHTPEPIVIHFEPVGATATLIAEQYFARGRPATSAGRSAARLDSLRHAVLPIPDHEREGPPDGLAIAAAGGGRPAGTWRATASRKGRVASREPAPRGDWAKVRTAMTRENQSLPEHPQDGDILVSRSSGRVEHDVSIVPGVPHSTCATHDRAVTKACELAEQLHVDVWLTEDHVHFLRIGCHRGSA